MRAACVRSNAWGPEDEWNRDRVASVHRRGLRVPEDVSVAGFDDIPFALDIRPGLTTIRVPMEDLGRRAFDLALGPRPAGFRVEHLATALVARESTAPART